MRGWRLTVRKERGKRPIHVTFAYSAGRVYNVTEYMEYHPGGWDELIRGAGKDATDLFNEVHRWVNYESMLAACLVGKLVDDHHSPSNQAEKAGEKAEEAAFSRPSLPSAKPGEPLKRWCISPSLLYLFDYALTNATNLFRRSDVHDLEIFEVRTRRRLARLK